MRTSPPNQKSRGVRGFLAGMLSTWRSSRQAPTVEESVPHPASFEPKSVVLTRALEEYVALRKTDKSLSASQFCERYPAHRKSIRRMLNVQWCLEHEVGEGTGEETIDGAASGRSIATTGVGDRAGATNEAGEAGNTLPTPDKAIRWPRPGEEFRGFWILEEMGQGGIARVFLASEQTLSKRLVVLKVARFGLAEALTLGKLNHPNIVPIFGVRIDPESSLTAVSMPYNGRATLCDLIDLAFAHGAPPVGGRIVLDAARRSVPSDEFLANSREVEAAFDGLSYVECIVRLVIQLADALAYTHKTRILHRDLKPSNILLTPQGVPMLLDFNLSADIDKVPAVLGGTLAYMPPEVLDEVIEQAPTSRQAGDARSDLFSLAAILYELLAGRPPFGEVEQAESLAWSANQLLERQLSGALAPPASPDICDAQLFAILRRSLDISRQQRHASAQEFADDLRNYLKQRQKTQKAAELVQTRRRWLAAAGTAAAVVATPFAIHYSLLPPVADREFEAGLLAFSRQDFHAAVVHFNRALDEQADDCKVLFARGQAQRKLGVYRKAMEDYRLVADKVSHGLVYACLAHCISENGMSASALEWHERAAAAGYADAIVHNNLGMLYAAARDKFDLAWRHFTTAIEMDATLCEPHEGRALLCRGQFGNSLASLNLDQAVVDIETAVRIGPATQRLYYEAVTILLHVSQKQSNPTLRDRAVGYLVQGLENGMPSTVLTGPLESLRTDPRVASVARPSTEPLRIGKPFPLIPPSFDPAPAIAWPAVI